MQHHDSVKKVIEKGFEMTETAQPAPESNLSQQSTAVPEASIATSEKMLPQSELNSVIAGAKRDSFEKGYNKAVNELQAKEEHQRQSPSSSSLDEARARQIAEEQLTKYDERRVQEQQASDQKVAQERMQADQARVRQELKVKCINSEKYPDLEQNIEKAKARLDSCNLAVWLANSFDNTAGIINELSKHPAKLKAVAESCRLDESNALQGRSSDFTLQDITEISKSIKSNDQSQSSSYLAAPSRQLKSSNVATDTGKSASLEDMKRDLSFRL